MTDDTPRQVTSDLRAVVAGVVEHFREGHPSGVGAEERMAAAHRRLRDCARRVADQIDEFGATGYRGQEEINNVREAGGLMVVIALPWEMVAAHERQALKNHDQTVKRLAERGGLSACEAIAVLEDRDWRQMPDIDAHRRLAELMYAFHKADTAALIEEKTR